MSDAGYMYVVRLSKNKNKKKTFKIKNKKFKNNINIKNFKKLFLL